MAYTDLEYLQLPKFQRFFMKLGRFFASIPTKLLILIFAIGRFFKGLGLKIAEIFRTIVFTFRDGDYKTRTSYFVMGFGNVTRGQYGRGILFFVFEVAFILFMALFGGRYLALFGGPGYKPQIEDPEEHFIIQYADNSFEILLYGTITIVVIIAFLYTWYINIKQNKIAQEILATGKPLKSGKQDMQSLVDDQFHKTLLSLPLLGIFLFTVLPTIIMILVAFTNYGKQGDIYGPGHLPTAGQLFQWVGGTNFSQLFSVGGGSQFGSTFGSILLWTLIWAFFATFTNYFLGMIVAMLINKKGIKLKKMWRMILVVSIAIPQFISLLYVSQMFGQNGFVNGLLKQAGWIAKPLPFWTDKWWARITVIIINIWIGIPYLMLITTGILMNIPADLYESAKIDGASPVKMYFKITLPYMLFVTGPYLLTSFTGNMNNFNVIYLLTGGNPSGFPQLQNPAGHTDLLITWLFKLTADEQNYKMASVIGIMVFIVVAGLSLIVYNIIPSMKNEEDFQ